MLEARKILLCITGSIAAYKSAVLARLLIKQGAEVRVIMTHAASTFITPLTLATLTGHKVYTEISDGAQWNNHVELGMWADLMVIAPCTATTLAKCAQGIADNFLVAAYLSAKCPTIFAPAMDLDMWKHPTTTRNLELLKSYGNTIINVNHGFLASGLIGDGRMAEPEEIVDHISKYFQSTNDLQSRKILITAGPTYEAIDPVRFIGNRSSGKMGYAIAEECARRGAEVYLVSGPSVLKIHNPNITLISVQSAQEMYSECQRIFENMDIVIMAAAVADYRPTTYFDQKIKKSSHELNIQLTKTIDIAYTLGQTKKENQLLIGFALETQNELKNAKEKIVRKNFDLIVLNSLNDKGAGFGVDTNKITILDKKGNKYDFELKSKIDLAKDIMDTVIKSYPLSH